LISPYFTNYAYCLMPNHFHVLCKAKPLSFATKEKVKHEGTKKSIAFLKEEIPPNTFYESQFRRLFMGYAKAINQQEEGRYGSLFKAKFKRTLVTNEVSFQYFVQYIHHNPIHHEFALNYTDLAYSSYNIFIKQAQENQMIATAPVLRSFSPENNSEDLQSFIKAHKDFKRDFKWDSI
ncbi:MAG: hypothetical protein AAGJ18_22820, partial [Bacteroidota bacterium]